MTLFCTVIYFLLFFSVVSCGDIAEPQNGHVNIESTRYQGIAKYECNTGYELSGSDVRKCQSNGHWSGSPPQCIGRLVFLALAMCRGTMVQNKHLHV